VLEQFLRDGGLAAATETVKDVDTIANAWLDSGAKAFHLSGTVAQHCKGAADQRMAHCIRAGPVWRVVVMFADVLVTRGLVNAAFAGSLALVVNSHCCPKF
jgi:hypothetical protein